MADAPHVMIVEARFYEAIADALFEAATAVLDEAGATYDRFTVPGAFEIPGAISMAANAQERAAAPYRFGGFIGLGCVIRGQTTHYDYVCGESARGLQDLAIQRNLAIGYGILTCENRDQAMARALRDQEDRGGAAARACLAMIELKAKLGLEA